MADVTTLPDTKTAALFPGVPLIESPIFDSEDLAGFSDQEKTLARQLNTDGFGVSKAIWAPVSASHSTIL